MTASRLPSHHCHVMLSLLTPHSLKKLRTISKFLLYSNQNEQQQKFEI